MFVCLSVCLGLENLGEKERALLLMYVCLLWLVSSMAKLSTYLQATIKVSRCDASLTFNAVIKPKVRVVLKRKKNKNESYFEMHGWPGESIMQINMHAWV